MKNFPKVITGNECLPKKGGGNMKRNYFSFFIGLVIAGLLFYSCTKVTPAAEISTTNSSGPSSGFKFADMKIRYFVGGDAGDAFASIVYRGALDAAEMLKPYGVSVEYVFSGWDADLMLSQLRDAIASRPDAICFVALQGDEAIMPLAEEAKNAGIILEWVNVNLPIVREKIGGGYVGVKDLGAQGATLGNKAITDLGLKSGDRAVVFGAWGQPGRFFREEGTASAFEDHGMIVERIIAGPETASDPLLILPVISGQIQNHPETKVIVYSGGQLLAAAGTFMEACGKKPGEVYNIGFDTNAAVLDAFEKGYVQITSDQQPYLHGFMPIMNAFLTKNFGLSDLEIETGAGAIDIDNYNLVVELVKKGYR
ncbi:MAG: substrate-binding domain-containing protein [Treponema sp.]|nr:substrate-binding domain-containing protein [Treponema sp.]